MIKKLYYKLIGMTPDKMPMVKYWKNKDAVEAKVYQAKDGSTVMQMEGEDYPFPTFPRGHILFGPLSKLKHEIKNQVFNESWRKLEEGMDRKQVIKEAKEVLFNEIPKYFEPMKYDMLPPSKMCQSVREIYRAWTKVSPETSVLRDILCMIIQEDDAYRWRVSWLAQWFCWFFKWRPVKSIEYALSMLEHGEVVGDMKAKQRLLKRIIMLALEDPKIREKFVSLFREINWKKVRLTEADKYFLRGKYFKCDLDILEY